MPHEGRLRYERYQMRQTSLGQEIVLSRIPQKWRYIPNHPYIQENLDLHTLEMRPWEPPSFADFQPGVLPCTGKIEGMRFRIRTNRGQGWRFFEAAGATISESLQRVPFRGFKSVDGCFLRSVRYAAIH